MTQPNVLIVGGGIAGLSAAIALRKTGIACDVVEIRETSEGTSIGLNGRAVDALDELGVLDDCLAAGNALAGSVFARMYDAAGDPLPVPPIPAPPDSRLPGSVVIHRATFAAILGAHATRAGARIRIGITVADLRQDADGVDVSFTDGSQGHYDLVIGADGVHSTMRALIHGDAIKPEYTGLMGLRWLLPDPGGEPGFFHGPDVTVIVGHLRGGLAYVSTGRDLPNERVSPEQARDVMADILGRFSAPYLTAIREKLDADSEIVVRPFEWLLLPGPWHRGRVLVIGDAAHATTAHLSYGGGMALEDAVVLAQELSGNADVAQALDAFTKRRADRVRTVVETSVELLRMEQQRADPRAMGAVRGKAMSALSAPY